MKKNAYFSFNFIFIIFFAAFLFPPAAQTKVLYGFSYGSNRDLPGGDYSQFNINSAEECLKKCANDNKCAAYSFNRTSHNCFLKEFIPESVSVRGIISGYKLSLNNKGKKNYIDPTPVPRAPTLEILSNTKLPGGDLYYRHTENVKKCAQICRDNTRCKAFTFDINKRMCWLKDRISKKRYYSQGFTSGVKNSADLHIAVPPEPGSPDMEIMNQTDVPGGDYLQTYQENVRECSNVCRKDKICDVFTYVESTKLCKLKSFHPNPIRKNGNISGIKR